VHTYLDHRHQRGGERWDRGGVGGNLQRLQFFALGLVLENIRGTSTWLQTSAQQTPVQADIMGRKCNRDE